MLAGCSGNLYSESIQDFSQNGMIYALSGEKDKVLTDIPSKKDNIV